MRRLVEILAASGVIVGFIGCGLSGPGGEEGQETQAPPAETDPPPVDEEPDPPPPKPDPDPENPIEDPPPDPPMRCEADGGGAKMLDLADKTIWTYASVAECEQAVEAAGEGVVCGWFTPSDPVGPGGWDETGWRPLNIDTGIGLGRRPHLSFEDCLDATRNARGGVVCTNTGVGYKSAHIGTNQWCGASSNLPYCLDASVAAKNHYVCSFPSDGDGSGPGWVLTQIDGSTCNYLSSSMMLADCNAQVP